MIATLEYTLPEDRHDFDVACAAPKIYAALCAVVEHTRRRLKYAEIGAEARTELEEVRRVLSDEGVLELVYEL